MLGLEADAAWSDIGASAGVPGLLTVNDKINDLGTARGRVGFAFNQFLFYGTSGFAWADNRLSANGVFGLIFRRARSTPVGRQMAASR